MTSACPLCYDRLPDVKLPCDHNYCRQCFQRFLFQHIEEKKPCKGCPECGTPVPFENYLNQDDMKKYQEYLSLLYIAAQVHISCWSCSETFTFPSDSVPFSVVCTKCLQETCVACKDKMHIGKCASVFELFSIKPCPKCRVLIEKNQGCNHMTCQSCFYEFEWNTGNKYISGKTELYPIEEKKGFNLSETVKKLGNISSRGFFGMARDLLEILSLENSEITIGDETMPLSFFFSDLEKKALEKKTILSSRLEKQKAEAWARYMEENKSITDSDNKEEVLRIRKEEEELRDALRIRKEEEEKRIREAVIPIPTVNYEPLRDYIVGLEGRTRSLNRSQLEERKQAISLLCELRNFHVDEFMKLSHKQLNVIANMSEVSVCCHRKELTVLKIFFHIANRMVWGRFFHLSDLIADLLPRAEKIAAYIREQFRKNKLVDQIATSKNKAAINEVLPDAIFTACSRKGLDTPLNYDEITILFACMTGIMPPKVLLKGEVYEAFVQVCWLRFRYNGIEEFLPKN